MAKVAKTQRSWSLIWALVLSLGAHALLLFPHYQLNQPAPKKVIFATLKETAPRYSQRNVATEPEQTSQASETIAAKKKPSTKTVDALTSSKGKTKIPQQLPEHSKPTTVKTPTPKAAAAPPKEEVIGLSISQDKQAIDPLEQQYEQILLAHLRSKLTAPATLNGSVRLAIKFSYRQIATEVLVIRSSGNLPVDDWAVKAVLAANPFPTLPKEISSEYVFRPTLVIGE